MRGAQREVAERAVPWPGRAGPGLAAARWGGAASLLVVASPAVLLLWGLTAVLVLIALRQDGGQLTYALDDAYIHMAIARNLAQSGVWGVTPDGFAGATSSILWPLLLAAADRLIGVRDLTPLILNLLCASAVVVAAGLLLRRGGLPPAPAAAALAAIVLAAPLPTLVVIGMEHSLQVLVDLLFAGAAVEALARPRVGGAVRVGLLVLAPLVTSVRYEGLFLVGLAALLLAARGAPGAAGMLVLLGLLPPAAFGAVSAASGWYPLPTPVLLKGVLLAGAVPVSGGSPGLLAAARLLLARLEHLLTAAQILVLLGASTVLYGLGRRTGLPSWAPQQGLLLLTAAATLLQTLAASVGVFYRYEAYLVVLGLTALALTVGAGLRKGALGATDRGTALTRRAAVIGLAVAFAVFGERAAAALVQTPRAMVNIYQQQYQMGRFLRRYYAGQVVALNDIGAVCYLAPIHLLDVWGLASRDVASLRLRGAYGRAAVAALARQARVRIAVVYDRWFQDGQVVRDGVPPSWTLAGRWTIPDNVVAGDAAVSFYAVDPGAAAELRANLRAFAPDLPPGVRWDAVGGETSGAAPPGG